MLFACYWLQVISSWCSLPWDNKQKVWWELVGIVTSCWWDLMMDWVSVEIRETQQEFLLEKVWEKLCYTENAETMSSF